MSDIDDYVKWLQQAKKLLNVFQRDTKKDLKQSSEAIAKMLKDFQSKYAKELKPFEEEFEALAGDTKKAIDKKQGFSVADLNRQLARLQLKIELAVGQKDPLATPQIREQVLASARHKPVYEDKCGRIRVAIAELKALPGAQDFVETLEGLLEAGKALEPDYESAFAALGGLTAALEGGRKAAARFEESIGDKAFRKDLQDARDAVASFEKACGQGQPGKLAEHRKVISDELFALAALEGDALKKRLVDAGVALRNLKKQVDGEILSAGVVDELAKKNLKAIELSIQKLKTCAPVDVLAPWLEKYRVAAALVAQQKYEQAGTKVDEMEKKIVKEAGTYEQLQTAWKEVADKVQPLYEEAELKLSNEAEDHRRIACWQILGNTWRQILADQVAQRRYQAAIDAVEAAQLTKAFQQSLKDGELTYANPGTELQVEVSLQRKRVAARADPAFDKLMAKLHLFGGDPKPYAAKKQSLLDAFEKAAKVLLTTKPGAATAALKTFRTEVDRIVKALTTDLLEGDDAKLLSGLPDKPPATETLEAIKEVADALQYLAGYGYDATAAPMSDKPALLTMQADLKAAQLDAYRGTDVADKLKTLLADAQGKRKTVDGLLATRRKDGADLATQIEGKIATLRKGQHKRYAAFFDGLQQRVDTARLMLQGTVLKVLAQGESDLQALKKEVEGHETQFAVKGGGNFATVEATCERLLKEVDADDHKTYQPVLRKTLKTELEQVLKPDLAQLSPPEALKVLKKFEDERLSLLKNGAKQTKEHAGKIEGYIAEARKKLKALDSIVPKPEALIASLSQRLDRAAKQPASAAGEAVREVESVRVMIEVAQNGKAQALDQGVKVAGFNAEKQQQEYEAAVDVFEKNMLRQVAQLRDEIGKKQSNEDLYTQITATLKDAKKEAKAGSIALAHEKLRLAETTAKSYLANPYGATGVGRRALPGAEQGWVAVANEFERQVGAIVNKIEGLSGDPDFDLMDGAEVLEAMRGLQPMFNPQLFASYVKPLSDEPPTSGPELGKRRLLKEYAILGLRRYQKLLDENTLIPLARDNPFGIALPLDRMKAALRSLEGALVAC